MDYSMLYFISHCTLYSLYGLQKSLAQKTCMITLTNTTLNWTHALMTFWEGKCNHEMFN